MTEPFKSSLNFGRVEALRKHMILTSANMAKVLGVSRITYMSWVSGKAAIRASNDAVVRKRLNQLFAVMKEHKWPQPEVIAMNGTARFALLLELLEKQE